MCLCLDGACNWIGGSCGGPHQPFSRFGSWHILMRGMMIRAVYGCLAGMVALAPAARSSGTMQQGGSSNASAVHFETASIKTSPSGSVFHIRPMPGGLRITDFTVMQLIRWAYDDIPERDVLGLADWARNRRFDVEGRVSGGPATMTQLRLMLRSLLAERFSLEAVYERRTRPIYALMINRRDGKLGPALHPSTWNCRSVPREGIVPPVEYPTVLKSEYCGIGVATNNGMVTFLSGTRVTTTEIASRLSRYLDRSVVDRTSLASAFDFILLPTQAGPAASLPLASVESSGPNPALTGGEIFTAMREQLGLKLEPGTGEVDVLVVRGVTLPAEN